MNQLACNQLYRFTRLASKLNLRTCSNQLNCLIRSSNQLVQSSNQPSKLPARNLSQSSVCLMQEKPKPGADRKNEDPVLIAEINEKPDDNIIKRFFQQYGKLGIVIYISVSISTIFLMYLAIDWGVDLSSLTETYGISAEVGDTIKKYEGGSKFVLAYALSKVLLPVRLSVTMAILFILKNVIKIKF